MIIDCRPNKGHSEPFFRLGIIQKTKMEKNVRTDHAAVINPSGATHEILEYLAKKANRLGLDGREVVRVFVEEDTEGRHVYYESDSIIKT